MSTANETVAAETKPAPQPAKPLIAAVPAKPDVQHQEPQEGGSYTRNLNTGELIMSEPAVADQE